jgi:hypothetical protein
VQTGWLGRLYLKMLGFTEVKTQGREFKQTDLDEYGEGGCDGLYMFSNF